LTFFEFSLSLLLEYGHKIRTRRISKGSVDETSARDALIDERLKAQNLKN